MQPVNTALTKKKERPVHASKDMIIKSFNDPILELDSKYDLSPEETLPENFLEIVEDDEEEGAEVRTGYYL